MSEGKRREVRKLHPSDEPCVICGGPVPPGIRRERQVCDKPECATAVRQWAASRRADVIRSRREMLAGERTCDGPCGRTLPLDAEHFPYSNKRNGKTYFRRFCRACWCEEYNRNHVRRYRQAVQSDPERRARYLESERLRHKLRQERETGSVGTKRSSKAANAWMPVAGKNARREGEWSEPLALWLDEVVAAETRDLTELSDVMGVPERRLWGIRHREFEQVAMGTADKMLWGYDRAIALNGDRIAATLEARCRAMPGNGERILRYMDLVERVAYLDGAVIVSIDDLWPEMA